MASVPHRLQEVLKKAEGLLESVASSFDGSAVFSVEERIRSAMSLEEDREKRVQISHLINELKEFGRSMATKRSDADAQIIIEETGAYAYLTLIPPRPGGRMTDFGAVMKEINFLGITQGLNFSAVSAACEKLKAKEELIYKLKIAECHLPRKGEDAAIEYKVLVFDKAPIFDSGVPFEGDLLASIQTVEAGTCVARVRAAGEGELGMDVRGKSMPGMRGTELSLKFGDGLRVAPSRAEVHAALHGVLVKSGDELDVIPFYVVSGDLLPGQNVSFAGNVVVTGNVLGPVSIRAEDLFVMGRVEEANIASTGDVWIGGGFIGKKRGVLEADGRLATRLISDATVQTLGDVVVWNSITYSDVTSNGRVKVTTERGAVVGGSVSALKEIVAKNVGSDFGTYTSTTVGRDFLTPKRMESIEKRIRQHEEQLSKIDLLKRKFAEARVDVTKLPPDKQDMYLSVLQKEIKAREELSGLLRGRERFVRSMKDFLQASIRVMEQLHPPVKVQIGEAVQEIRERLEKVVLSLDSTRRIQTKRDE